MYTIHAVCLCLFMIKCILITDGYHTHIKMSRYIERPSQLVLKQRVGDLGESQMSLDELKAELDLRGVDYSDCISKGELAARLTESRISGRADPKIIDTFNSNEVTTDNVKEIFDNADFSQVTAKDGNLPGGLPPQMMKLMASDPEIVNMLRDPKMQDIMTTMMSGGQEAMKKYMSDPDAIVLMNKLSKAIQRVTDGP